MKKKKPTAGESMLEGAKQALAFARGEKEHGCVAHIPEESDVKAIGRLAMTKKKYRSEAFAALHASATDLYQAGLIDARTMRAFDASCLMPGEKVSRVHRSRG